MKRTRFIAIALAVLIAVAFVSCDGDNATPPQKECEHEWNRVVTKDSTCAEVGEAVLTCTKCGEKKTEEIPLHHYVDYRCTVCKAWGKGPAGGYVFYDCDADNDPNINGGRGKDNLMSSECEWRFLEAAPADLRLIKGVPTVDSSAEGYAEASEGNKKFNFGFYRKTPDGENLPIDAKKEVGTGKENTRKFYEAMGDKKNGYRYATQNKIPFNEYPARLCSILEYTGADGEIYGDWFLPSLDEVEEMYKQLYLKGFGSSAEDRYFHSSVTGSGDNPFEVWSCGKGSSVGKGFNQSVSRSGFQALIRPIRAFKPET